MFSFSRHGVGSFQDCLGMGLGCWNVGLGSIWFGCEVWFRVLRKGVSLRVQGMEVRISAFCLRGLVNYEIQKFAMYEDPPTTLK